MKLKIVIAGYLVISSIFCLGQAGMVPVVRPAFMPGVPAGNPNYKTFSQKKKVVDEKWLIRNSAYVLHPDAGYIAEEQPPGNVIELLEKRTETTRFYVDADSPSKIFSQGSYGPLHYKKSGKWLIIDSRLDNQGSGLLEASHQPEPVGFDINNRKSFIRTTSGIVRFNDWKLFGTNEKEEKLLAKASWENYTAGDEGIFVTNIFPGIDAEMRIFRGRVKTSLIIRKWQFEGFQSYRFADTFQAPEKGSLNFVSDKNSTGEVDFRVGGKLMARVGRAVVYAESDPESAIVMPYELRDSELGIKISNTILQKLLQNGAVVIDPMVMGPDGVFTPGSVLNSYNNENCSYDFNNSCSYEWTVPVPPFITPTNSYFGSEMMTFAPCTRDKMRFIYGFGDKSCGTDIVWETLGQPQTPGATSGSGIVAPYYNNCIKAGCEMTNIKVRFFIIRGCMGPAGCESSCVQGIGPFVTTIEGRTVELTAFSATPDITQCPGEAVKLSAAADFGIKPYSFLWTPGNSSGSDIEVTPGVTTTYKVTVKDACNQKVSDEVFVTVPLGGPSMTVSIAASTGPVCAGTKVDFTSKVQFVDNPVYQWKINGVNVSGANSATFTSDKILPGNAVTLEVTNPALCAFPKVLESKELKVNIYPAVVENVVTNLSDCDSVTFEGKIYKSDTTLHIKMLSSFGCDSLNRTIEIVIEKFKLELSVDPQPPFYIGESVALKAGSNVADFEITSWQPPYLFPDQKAISQNFKMPENDSLFTVHGKTTSGCQDSASVILTRLNKPMGNMLPNVFTPNGDGLNDVWEPLRKSTFPVGELFVYNRWGECIFHTMDYTVPWDGKQKGSKIPAGVYPYRLIIAQKYEFKGSVTVLY